MAEYFLEPQNPLKKIDETTGDINYIYPLTTDKQVIMENGERLSTVLNESILYMSEVAEENSTEVINADTLGGKPAEYYANVEDIDNSIDEINTEINNINTEITNKIPFSFGIDSNGNYGYIKAGADTVTPFNLLLNAEVVYTNSKTITVPEGVRAAILSQVACYTGQVAPEFYHNNVLIDYIAWKQLEYNLDMLIGIAILPSVKSGDTVGFMSDGQTWENHVIVWLK